NLKDLRKMNYREPPWDEAIVISSDEFEKDVYWLLSIFHASKGLSRVSDEVLQVKSLWQESEAVRLLLNIAVVVRNRLEVKKSACLKGYQDNVGTLEFVSSGETRELTFREACNKIIHSKRVTFLYETEPAYAGDPLKDNVIVRGQIGNKDWIAMIDINKFSTLALVLG
ncbi:TPA: hypothetical protein ACQYFN_004737, partial [Vibrio parahaemolyticus]|nr:hypothetical protein [Vibrio parahaemolyticus]